MADATGTTVWRWDQAEPFGNNPADEDPDANSVAFDLPLRLPGQRYDAETGLHYNYFRDYDPSLGRYGESDPIGLRAGLNTYAYVGSSPLRWVDPLGLAIKGRWIRRPYAHNLGVDYVGWHFDVGDWKWLPPGLRIVMLEFYGSATISFEIECTEDGRCKSRTWTISPHINVGTDIEIPLRWTIYSHPIITGAKIAKAAYDAKKYLEHWAQVQAGYYAASDPTNWCIGIATIGGDR